MQSEASATQVPPKQHPLLHVLPAQQGSVGCPQRAQRPLPVLVAALQMVPAEQRSEPSAPSQHGSPGPPHVEHAPLRQMNPA